jgi:hypothetical protein
MWHPSKRWRQEQKQERQPTQTAAAPAQARHQPPQQRTTRCSPQGPVALSASSDTVNIQPDYPALISEMQEIQAMLAAMTASPMQGLYTGMSVPPDQSPHTSLLSSAPPRDFYCWLHGWNSIHHGGTCNIIMGTNQAYTPAMRSARGPDGTGRNPKIGVPVQYSRPPKFFPPFTTCSPCRPVPLPTFSPACPPLSPATSVKINADLPY